MLSVSEGGMSQSDTTVPQTGECDTYTHCSILHTDQELGLHVAHSGSTEPQYQGGSLAASASDVDNAISHSQKRKQINLASAIQQASIAHEGLQRGISSDVGDFTSLVNVKDPKPTSTLLFHSPFLHDNSASGSNAVYHDAAVDPACLNPFRTSQPQSKKKLRDFASAVLQATDASSLIPSATSSTTFGLDSSCTPAFEDMLGNLPPAQLFTPSTNAPGNEHQTSIQDVPGIGNFPNPSDAETAQAQHASAAELEEFLSHLTNTLPIPTLDGTSSFPDNFAFLQPGVSVPHTPLSISDGLQDSVAEASSSADVQPSTTKGQKKGRRPRIHGCDFCAKRFDRQADLNRHVRVHTGETPYRCDEPGCGKGFKQVRFLNHFASTVVLKHNVMGTALGFDDT